MLTSVGIFLMHNSQCKMHNEILSAPQNSIGFIYRVGQVAMLLPYNKQKS